LRAQRFSYKILGLTTVKRLCNIKIKKIECRFEENVNNGYFLKNDTIRVAIWIADRNLKKTDRDLFFKIAIEIFWIAIQNGLQSKAGSTTGSKKSPTLKIINKDDSRGNS
jgi:hypothetical protein